MRIRSKIAYFYKIVGSKIELVSSCRVFDSNDEYTECTNMYIQQYEIEEKNIVFEYTLNEMMAGFKSNYNLHLHEKKVENKFSALF